MQHISLFSGIGGFDLASEWMGWDNILSCENDGFCRKVLKYYWPDSYHHKDIHDLTYETIIRNSRFRKERRTILTGGFPCQPYSAAGKRKGTEDARHLWPEMLRVIRIVRPNWIVGENVYGLINWNDGLVFNEICTDLEKEGYEVVPVILPASSVGAPHRRDRIWFIAYSGDEQLQEWTPKRNGQDKAQKKAGMDDRSERSGNIGIIANAPSDGQHDQPTTKDNRIGKNNKQSGDRRVGSVEGLSNEQHVTDSDSNGSRDQGKQERQQFRRRGSAWGKPATLSKSKDAPDTGNEGLQRSKEFRKSRRESNKQSAGRIFAGWDNFPTVSPVCQRNDEFSNRLSGITFPKWRNEGIKAMGNAVVPRLVYQIFKTIEKFEQEKDIDLFKTK